MIYKELLALRRAVLVFCSIVFAIGLVNVIGIHSGSAGTGSQPLTSLVLPIDSATLFLLAWLVAMLATVYGGSIASDGGEHGRMAFLRPISRTQGALMIVGVDLVAIVLAYLLGAIALYLPYIVSFGPRAVGAIFNARSNHTMDWFVAVGPLALAFAWYGLIAAVASTWRKAMVAVAVAWPIAIFSYILAFGWFSRHSALQWLIPWNPFAYYIPAINKYLRPADVQKSYGAYGQLSIAADVWILCTLGLCFLFIAIFQYRRMEVT